MKLATIRHLGSTRVVRIDGDYASDLGAESLVEVLQRPNWQSSVEKGGGPKWPVESLDYAPLIVTPEKVICVGLNYRTHILEMGRELPEFPTLFAKYARALIGANDPIGLPVESSAVDWEAELGVVVGSTIRRADLVEAQEAIAGYTVINDVTCRDWQYRTGQWLQGKTFEGTTPIGPWLVTTDEVPARGLELSCEVNGEVMQSANTGDLVFSPVEIVAYISKFITLVPGDVIATGTPGGVGHARSPQRYLNDGDTVTTRIDLLGQCQNQCREDR